MPYKSVGGGGGPESSWKEVVRSGERARFERCLNERFDKLERLIGRLENRLEGVIVKLEKCK